MSLLGFSHFSDCKPAYRMQYCREGSLHMKSTFVMATAIAFCLLLSPFACKGEPEVWTIGPDPADSWFDKNLPEATGSPVFTVLPISEQDLQKIYPLGMIGSHTFPTDHIYLAHTASTPVSVYAPAAGRILYIEQPEESSSDYNDNSIRVAISKDFTYVLGHIMADDSLYVGQEVQAGQLLGTTVSGSSLDLLVLDRAKGNSLENEKYPMTMPFAQNPIEYFTLQLQQCMTALRIPPVPNFADITVNSQSAHDPSLDVEHAQSFEHDATRDIPTEFMIHYQSLSPTYTADSASFEYDLQGKLQGNWFIPGNTAGQWDEGIAFVYDPWYPTQMRISCNFGVDGDTYGRYAVHPSLQSGLISFSEISAGQTATYVLYAIDQVNWHGVPIAVDTNKKGLVKILMVDERTIKVEFFSDTSDTNPSFSSAARFYYR